MIKPLADRIVVKPAEAEQKTSSGLFIPDNAKEKPMQGKVVAVGPGRKNDKGELIAQKVPVTTGVETDYEIEIFSDELTEGDLIVDDPDGVVQGQIIPYMG